MQLHELKIKNPNKDRKRVGRGGKRGTYSGKGQKGQKSRSGHSFQPAIRNLIKRYHKLRGYRLGRRDDKYSIVNLGIIEKTFSVEEVVNVETLVTKGIIRKIKGRFPKIKVLGNGEIIKKLVFENCEVSAKAKEKIEKVGGTIKISK
ncbi:MAG: 50S ribosomal protein L15 [Patescibacteria group bacterium]